MSILLPSTTKSAGITIPAPIPAPGGGLSYSAITMRTIDPTSMTLVDPSSLIKSTNIASGVITMTFNALAVGSQDYTLTGATHSFPRYYMDLQADDGDGTFTTLTTDDYAVVYFRMSTFSADFQAKAFVAAAIDPTNNASASMQGYGSFLYKTATTPGAGVWDQANTLQLANAATDSMVGTLILTPQSASLLTTTSLQADGTRINIHHYVLSDSTAAATDWKLMIGAATRINSETIADGEQVAAKFEYQAFKLSI